jgi:hypothetical protein
MSAYEFQMWDQVQLLLGGPVMTVYGLGDKRVHVAFVFENLPVKCWIDCRMLKPAVAMASILTCGDSRKC